jgi:hypothetical protein
MKVISSPEMLCQLRTLLYTSQCSLSESLGKGGGIFLVGVDATT